MVVHSTIKTSKYPNFQELQNSYNDYKKKKNLRKRFYFVAKKLCTLIAVCQLEIPFRNIESFGSKKFLITSKETESKSFNFAFQPAEVTSSHVIMDNVLTQQPDVTRTLTAKITATSVIVVSISTKILNLLQRYLIV